MHLTVADILKVIMRTTKIESGKQAAQVIDNTLATTQYTLCCSVNHTMKISPSSLVFQQDTFINLSLHTNLKKIRQR